MVEVGSLSPIRKSLANQTAFPRKAGPKHHLSDDNGLDKETSESVTKASIVSPVLNLRSDRFVYGSGCSNRDA